MGPVPFFPVLHTLVLGDTISMNGLLLTAPTGLADWGRVLGVSPLGYLIVELEE